MPKEGLTLLVDSASLIYRAFFSTPDTVSTPEGQPINAAYGFISMLARLLEDLHPSYVCCALDDNWRPDWRVELIGEYKAQRAEEGSAQAEVEDQLDHQLPAIADLLDLVGVPMIGYPDYEAEDVIGSLAERAPGEVAIVSGDRDLFQLVRDPDIWVIYPRRGVSQVDRVDEAFIESKYGIPGRSYFDYAVLRGDPSDGLPGVRGIGEKTATALISKYGDLDGVIEAAASDTKSSALDKVRVSLDYIERARKVVKIPTDLPIPETDLSWPKGTDRDVVIEVGKRYGISSPARSLVDAALAGAQD